MIFKNHNPNTTEMQFLLRGEDINYVLEYLHNEFYRDESYNHKWLRDPDYKSCTNDVSVKLRFFGYKIT